MARETWEAYGFVGNAGDDPAALVGSVASVRGIRFTARTVGAYDALLAVETPTLSMLQDEIATAVARAGARDVRWSIVVDSLRFHPKRRDTDVAAFVRFPADDPVATAEALHDEFASLNDRSSSISRIARAAGRSGCAGSVSSISHPGS